MRERKGIPCAHILAVIRREGQTVENYPQLIRKRWLRKEVEKNKVDFFVASIEFEDKEDKKKKKKKKKKAKE